MHRTAHERCDCGIDESVTFQLRAAAEGIRHQPHAQVGAAACTGVSGVPRAVVEDLE
jgi:hypothetical protein